MFRNFTILFLFFCFKGQAQVVEISPESILKKMRELYLQKNLDSIQTRIAFHKSRSVLDSTKQFYIYRDTLFHSEGKYSIGYRIIDYNMEADGIPIGEWTTYYYNGQAFSKGFYSIGAIVNCQASGASASYYAYRSGLWTYWYENGQVLGQGEFTPIWKAFTDTCGEDRYLEPHVTSNWKFYNDNGLPNHKNKDLIRLVDEDRL